LALGIGGTLIDGKEADVNTVGREKRRYEPLEAYDVADPQVSDIEGPE
jgi:hypothetical protein